MISSALAQLRAISDVVTLRLDETLPDSPCEPVPRSNASWPFVSLTERWVMVQSPIFLLTASADLVGIGNPEIDLGIQVIEHGRGVVAVAFLQLIERLEI